MRDQSAKLEQFARRRAVAPVVEAPLALGVGLDQVEPGLPAGHAQHQVGLDPLGAGQRDNAVRIAIVAERGGIGHVDAGAREIDRSVKGIAAAALAEAAVAAAGHLDHDLAHRHHAGFLIAHSRRPAHSLSTPAPIAAWPAGRRLAIA